jgi:hypothetical protein
VTGNRHEPIEFSDRRGWSTCRDLSVTPAARSPGGENHDGLIR